MSFFGTLRKVRKGKQPSEHNFEKTLQKIQEDFSPSLSLSSSTPNLNKIQRIGGSSGSSIKSSRNRSSNSALNVTTDDDDDSRSTGADSVETSTSSENPNRSQSPNYRRPSFSFTTGKLSSFVANAKSRGKVKRPRFQGSSPILFKSQSFFNDIDENSVSVHTSWQSIEEDPDSEESMRRNSSGSVQINLKWREAVEKRAMSITRRSSEERKRDELIIQGVKKFNRDPKRGMEFLVKNLFVGESPEDHARFLKNTENLSKTSIGTFLGEHDQFNQDVLAAFVRLHEFTEEHLVASLRKFLASFRLPGEAQKIDRMMEAFASHYCSQNPNVFSNSDTCYLLSYALIMLNTTLHNPNVKDKPTLERFINMNRDIDDGKSLDPKLLVSLYESIRNEQFQIIHEDGNTDLKLTFMNADINGWLWKQGAKYKNWKRRWFVLNNNCLYYFMHQKDKVPRSIIPLENIHASEVRTHGKYFIFTLTKSSSNGSESIKSCKTLSDGTIVLGIHSEFVLGAETVQERDEWVEAIQQNSSFDQYYTLLQEKKRKMAEIQANTLRRDKSGRSHKPVAIRKSQISMPVTRPKTEHGNLLLVEQQSFDSTGESEYNEDFHGHYPNITGSDHDQSVGAPENEDFSIGNESSDSESQDSKMDSSSCVSDDKTSLPVICISCPENNDEINFPIIYPSGAERNEINFASSYSREETPPEASDNVIAEPSNTCDNISLNVPNVIEECSAPLETSFGHPDQECIEERHVSALPLLETSISFPNLDDTDDSSSPTLLLLETSVSSASLNDRRDYPASDLPLLETSVSSPCLLEEHSVESDSDCVISQVSVPKIVSTVIKRDEISLRDHRQNSQTNEHPTSVVLDFAVTATSSVC
ncbi:unnamed protein product [Allacma fusca]|uniref:Uncharacterized protein n=1 Tax=Allacma fusca TaxID=39272 RepID=A0A8J2JGN7_9HEXA|nr:unnamed protein product [Allacma fusca]